MGSPIVFSWSSAQSDLETTRDTLQNWIETEKKLAAEVETWDREKLILDGIVGILEDEIQTLESKIEKGREEVSQADAKRAELSEQKEELKNASAVIVGVISKLEDKVHGLYPLFPDPLQNTIDQLYMRMPKKDDKDVSLSLSARMQNIIGILSQVDKFNGSITLEKGLRQLPDGRQVEIKTLYLGIAYAYFIDESGGYVGFRVPTNEGWSWVEKPEMAEIVREAIEIYEDPQRANYVNLPVTIE